MSLSLVTVLRRDSGAPLLQRMAGRVSKIDEATRTVIFDLSSETPVDRWGDIEILLHTAEAVRLDRLRTVGSLHLFHDVTLPCAAIRDAQIVNKTLQITVQFGQTQANKDAFQNVVDGVIRGLSVGYVVHQWQVNQDTRTYTATDWEPYEATLTTIPADPSITTGRSSDEQALWSRSITSATAPLPSSIQSRNTSMKITIRALLLILATYRHLETEISSRAENGATEVELRTWAEAQPKPGTAPVAPVTAVPGDEAARALELATARAERDSAQRSLKLTELALTHGIDTKDMDLRSFPSEAAGMEALLVRKATNMERRPGQPVGGVVTVGADAEDKRRDAMVDGLLHSTLSSTALDAARRNSPKEFADLKLPDKDLGMRRCTPQDMVRRYLPEAAGWDGESISRFATRQTGGLLMRDANQSAANFATILGNFADKAVLIGYMGQQTTHQLWTSQRLVKDFRPVAGAALQAGLLKEQLVKGAPGEEINLLEKSYQASLGLFLRSATFTYQDWRNDDLGQFANELSQLGLLAALTEDWQVYKLLLSTTWSGQYLTTTSAFWDDTNDRLKYTGLGKAQADLENRSVAVGDESIPIQPVTRTLVTPVKRRAAARAATGQGPANLLPHPAPDTDIQVVSSPWLANASLTGFSADDYYLIAGNMDSIKVLRDLANPRPSIRQVDAGATPDQKYLIMHAFRALLATQDSMQKAQWA